MRRELGVVGGEESKERTAATVLDVEGRRVILFLEQRDVLSGQQGVEDLEDTVLHEEYSGSEPPGWEAILNNRLDVRVSETFTL